jgi:nucleoside-diphosphate-sugar epimerase
MESSVVRVVSILSESTAFFPISTTEAPGFSCTFGDLNDSFNLIRLLLSIRPNEIYHLGGEVSREFLYVEVAAVGIMLATRRYDDSEPVNLGTGCEVRIRYLVEQIRQLVGHRGEISWNHSRPDGQPRRRLDVTKAFGKFGFRAQADLRESLRKQ